MRESSIDPDTYVPKEGDILVYTWKDGDTWYQATTKDGVLLRGVYSKEAPFLNLDEEKVDIRVRSSEHLSSTHA